jgi:hypothetical protein
MLLPPPLMLPPPPVLAPPVGRVDGDGEMVATGVTVGVGVALGVGVHGVFDGVGFGLQGFFFDVVAAVVAFLWQGVLVGAGLGDQELSSLPLLPQFDWSSPVPLPLPWPETETLAAEPATDSVLACAAVPEASSAAVPIAKQPAVKRMRPAIPAPPSRDFSRGSVKNPVVSRQAISERSATEMAKSRKLSFFNR